MKISFDQFMNIFALIFFATLTFLVFSYLYYSHVNSVKCEDYCTPHNFTYDGKNCTCITDVKNITRLIRNET
jgi:hypothetical protein